MVELRGAKLSLSVPHRCSPEHTRSHPPTLTEGTVPSAKVFYRARCGATEKGVAYKTLFHRRIIGSEEQSVDCWYLVIADDRSLHIQHTWERSVDGTNGPTKGSTTLPAQDFIDTTQNEEVLGSLGAMLVNAGIRADSRLHE